MKKLPALLLGAASALLLGATTHAQTTTAYNSGDLLLGFRATDRTQSYLVNLGPATNFTNATLGQPITLSLGNIGADLVNVFGADWYSRIDTGTGTTSVLFSIVGTARNGALGFPNTTIFTSNPLAQPYDRAAAGVQGAPSNSLASLGNTYQLNQSTANSPVGLIQNNSTTNSYAYFLPGGGQGNAIPFDYFDPSNEASPSQTVFLNQLLPGTGPGTILGTFSISPTGSVTYVSAVPEPSTYAAGAFFAGVAGLVLHRRRRLAAVA